MMCSSQLIGSQAGPTAWQMHFHVRILSKLLIFVLTGRVLTDSRIFSRLRSLYCLPFARVGKASLVRPSWQDTRFIQLWGTAVRELRQEGPCWSASMAGD